MNYTSTLIMESFQVVGFAILLALVPLTTQAKKKEPRLSSAVGDWISNSGSIARSLKCYKKVESLVDLILGVLQVNISSCWNPLKVMTMPHESHFHSLWSSLATLESFVFVSATMTHVCKQVAQSLQNKQERHFAV